MSDGGNLLRVFTPDEEKVTPKVFALEVQHPGTPEQVIEAALQHGLDNGMDAGSIQTVIDEYLES